MLMPMAPDEPDLTRLGRRRMLQLLGVAGVATLAGCGDDDDATSPSPPTSSAGASTPTSAEAGGSTAATAGVATTDALASTSAPTDDTTGCSQIPEETAGPYPGDGSNGPDVLTQDGVVRTDITTSFGSSSTVADGVPMTINLTLLDVSNDCSALAGAGVYVWHCDRGGGYSLYSQGVENENYLRGVQESDADGRVTFQSVFPACYSGRWPHIHFEVYESLDAATGGGTRIATSQVALPEGTCDAVYATEGYEQSVESMSQVSLGGDNVFGDDAGVSQTASVEGDVGSGLTVELVVPVDPTSQSSGGAGGGAPPGGPPGGSPPGASVPGGGVPGGYSPPGYRRRAVCVPRRTVSTTRVEAGSTRTVSSGASSRHRSAGAAARCDADGRRDLRAG